MVLERARASKKLAVPKQCRQTPESWFLLKSWSSRWTAIMAQNNGGLIEKYKEHMFGKRGVVRRKSLGFSRSVNEILNFHRTSPFQTGSCTTIYAQGRIISNSCGATQELSRSLTTQWAWERSWHTNAKVALSDPKLPLGRRK